MRANRIIQPQKSGRFVSFFQIEEIVMQFYRFPAMLIVPSPDPLSPGFLRSKEQRGFIIT